MSSKFTVTETAQNISGLEDGKRYNIQYFPKQGKVEYIEYCNAAADPSAVATTGWFKLHPLPGPDGVITTGRYDSSNPLWIRVPNFDQDSTVDTSAVITYGEGPD